MAKFYVCIGKEKVILEAPDPLTAAKCSLGRFGKKRNHSLIYVDERGPRTRYALHRYLLERCWDNGVWWRAETDE
jgi:hypothetical protein